MAEKIRLIVCILAPHLPDIRFVRCILTRVLSFKGISELITLTTNEMDRTQALEAVCAIVKDDFEWFNRRIVTLFMEGIGKANFDQMEPLALWWQNSLSILYYEIPRTATSVPRVYIPTGDSRTRVTWEYKGSVLIELSYSSESASLRLTHTCHKVLSRWQAASLLADELWVAA